MYAIFKFMNQNYKICDIESVECIGEFVDEYVYDLEMEDDPHMFFANDILIHNSSHITLTPLLQKHGVPFYTLQHGKRVVTDDALKIAKKLQTHLNKKIDEWSKHQLNSLDSRLEFKIETLCDSAIYLEKKRYILHKLYDEGIIVDKFKYVGVEVVRTTMPKPVKPLVKELIESMILLQDEKKVSDRLKEVYELFKSFPLENIAFTMGIKGYEKYAQNCNGFVAGKRTPIHVKSAYFYNTLLKNYSLVDKYEAINSGDKMKYFYVQQPNKFGITCMGFKYKYPKEFTGLLKPDYEFMFSKIIAAPLERLYDAVKWRYFHPRDAIQTNLLDLLS